MNIYQIPDIRRTNHTIALYDNIILRPLSPSARDKLTNVPRHRRSRHQSWRELHNDTRLIDNPNPPTVDHNYKTHIPDTVNHNDIILYYLSDRYTLIKQINTIYSLMLHTSAPLLKNTTLTNFIVSLLRQRRESPLTTHEDVIAWRALLTTLPTNRFV